MLLVYTCVLFTLLDRPVWAHILFLCDMVAPARSDTFADFLTYFLYLCWHESSARSAVNIYYM